MCSIAGIIYTDKRKVNEKLLESMQNVMNHRGPDENGIYTDENVGLAHCRLTIIDKESGKQPMTFQWKNKEYTIVYNGEIYNTSEIRERLKSLGMFFTGYSDTEVVLKTYILYKEKCVEYLNGIFAFAIYEKDSGKIFLARDRMGVKPLFYSFKENMFCFASEIKGILADDKIPAIIDSQGIDELFILSPGRTLGITPFAYINELKPAEYMIFDNKNKQINKKIYWQMTAHNHTDSFEETAEKVRFLLSDAIKRQLVSDYPVGTFLSGGIDSSIISSVANEEYKKTGKILDTFSLDYKGNDIYFKASAFQPSSDTEYIYRMQQYLGCNGHWCVLEQDDVADALYDSVCARDLPSMADIDSSMLLFCKDISRYVKVALSGECADEIFGGYPWYRNISEEKVKIFPWADCIEYRTSFINKNLIKYSKGKEYAENAVYNTVKNISFSENDSIKDRNLREMIHLNTSWFMQNLLERKDRMSMASSLEVRVPFCDYRIAEYLYSVPMKFKNHGGYEKGLLREAFRNYLTDEVLWRKKSPYPKTHHPYYEKKVSEILQNIISDSTSPLLEIADKSALQNLIDSEKSYQWYGQLMKKPQIIAYFIQMNYWLKKYNIKMRN